MKRLCIWNPVLQNTRSWVVFLMAKISAFDVPFAGLDIPAFGKPFWSLYDTGYCGLWYIGCPSNWPRIYYSTFSMRRKPSNIASKNESQRFLWGGSNYGSPKDRAPQRPGPSKLLPDTTSRRSAAASSVAFHQVCRAYRELFPIKRPSTTLGFLK